MTTPERLRRRQYIEGVLLAFVGLMVVITSIVDDRRDDRQEDEFKSCIISVVGDLTKSLDARSSLTEPRARAVEDLIAGLLTADGDQRKAEQIIVDYQTTQRELNKVAKDNPYPPFPDGTCES